MVSWPALGTRVSVRYRRPTGSVPPLTDAVGHLLAVDPVVRVRTKTGALVEFAPADAVALRVLTDAPVRTAQIRSLEHAAAAAWPSAEQAWLDGWLLRAGDGTGYGANSAVPLDVSAGAGAIPAIAAWYTDRGLTPLLAIPDRLLRPPPGLTSEYTERVLVRDLPRGPEAPGDDVGATPGEFARAAVTDAPDGTRWLGLTALGGTGDYRDARAQCQKLLAWGARRDATHAYARVGEDDAAATAVVLELGFWLHHRTRYFAVASGAWDSV